MEQTEFWVTFNRPIENKINRTMFKIKIEGQLNFALEIEFEDLPMYLNDERETVRTVVSERLKGKTQQGITSAEFRYFPFSKETKLLCKF